MLLWKIAELLTEKKHVCLALQCVLSAIFWNIKDGHLFLAAGLIFSWLALTYCYICEDTLAAFRVLGFKVVRAEYNWSMYGNFYERDHFFDSVAETCNQLGITCFKKDYIIGVAYLAFKSQEEINLLKLLIPEKYKKHYEFFGMKNLFWTESQS